MNTDTANELRVAAAIRRRLDEGAERLPYRITERLAAGRARALARVIDRPSTASSTGPRLTQRSEPRGVGERLDAFGVSLRWRVAATVLPLALLVLGVFVADGVQQDTTVTELAELDGALLTDDVPLDAYADRGFGVYINNTRR